MEASCPDPEVGREAGQGGRQSGPWENPTILSAGQGAELLSPTSSQPPETLLRPLADSLLLGRVVKLGKVFPWETKADSRTVGLARNAGSAIWTPKARTKAWRESGWM